MHMICIGDSLTYGYGVRRELVWTARISARYPLAVIVNKGISGDTTGGMLARFEKDVAGRHPETAFIMGGSNDIFFEREIRSAKGNMSAMVFRCLHEKIRPVIGIPFPVVQDCMEEQWVPYAGGTDIPRMLKEYRDFLLKFGRNFGIKIVDFNDCFPEGESSKFYLDGIHLNAEGHEAMACFAAEALKTELGG